MVKQCNIVMIGAGNMATRLSIALADAGHNILQVYSRTLRSAKLLAEELGTNTLYTDNLEEIITEAHLYIFSISDQALSDVIAHMPSCSGMWVHTAGSMPMDIFDAYTQRYGVMYPMQTVSKERTIDWSQVPIFIEASNIEDITMLEEVARSISQQVTQCNSQQRQALHLAAVFACNFTNHMYAIAEQLLRKQGINFDAMKLLIRETELKAENFSPGQVQTGPAVRCDFNVMNKHLALLGDSPESELYRLISNNIIEYAKHEIL